jgi:hypothetical protein
MAHSLRSPNSIALYSAILLVHLSISLMNCRPAAYLNLMLEGEIRTVAALASVLHQAPSQYTCHGVSVTKPSI